MLNVRIWVHQKLHIGLFSANTTRQHIRRLTLTSSRLSVIVFCFICWSVNVGSTLNKKATYCISWTYLQMHTPSPKQHETGMFLLHSSRLHLLLHLGIHPWSETSCSEFSMACLCQTANVINGFITESNKETHCQLTTCKVGIGGGATKHTSRLGRDLLHACPYY